MKPSILFLILLAGCNRADERYQMVAAQGGSPTEIKVWVLDTVTGKVNLCFETAATIKCLSPSNRFPDQPW
jgi:hypothetical protein